MILVDINVSLQIALFPVLAFRSARSREAAMR
jgi:hypothetical protein